VGSCWQPIKHRRPCSSSTRSVGATHRWCSPLHLLDVVGVREDMKTIEEEDFLIPKAEPGRFATACMFVSMKRPGSRCEKDPETCPMSLVGRVHESGNAIIGTSWKIKLCPKTIIREEGEEALDKYLSQFRFYGNLGG